MPSRPHGARSRAGHGKACWRRIDAVVRLDDVFFFETLAFVIVFPVCWWIGGLVTQHVEREPEARQRRLAEVVDLAEWRRSRQRGSKAAGE